MSRFHLASGVGIWMHRRDDLRVYLAFKLRPVFERNALRVFATLQLALGEAYPYQMKCALSTVLRAAESTECIESNQ
jgi:hypothetical protein